MCHMSLEHADYNKSYTETLLDGVLEEEGLSDKFMNVINNEADRMTRLVNNLLELSVLIIEKLTGT